MRRLPPLNALLAFEATARLGSVTQAGFELGRTHGAVSKQLRVLSEALGHALFEKSGNRLVLTPQGMAFHEVIGPALDQIADGFAKAKASYPKSVLNLGVSATFASRWLMPRLPRFHAAHPGIAIDFKMAGRTHRPLSEYDVTITWDRLRFASDLFPYSAVGDVAFALVHAPSYKMAEHAGGYHVATRIVPDTLPEIWDIWGKLSGIHVRGDRDYEVPQTGLIIDAAASGMGVAILERRLIEAELQDERLVAPMGWTEIKGGFGVYFNTTKGRNKPETHAFVAWLRSVA